MGPTCCLVLSSPMPSAVVGDVRERFGDVRVSAAPAGVVIECSVPDQAASRALLTQVRDVGGAVVLVVAVTAAGIGRSRHGHDQR